MRALAIALLVVIAGCGSTPATIPLRSETQTQRYHHILLPDADPNGLAWDADRRMLYVADDDQARLLVVVNGVVLSTRDLGEAGGGAGGLAQLGDGSVASARFGTDGDGGIVRLLSDEAVRAVPGLDRARHRLGVAAYGDLYVAWFSGTHDAWTGGVARIDVFSGGETDVLTGLGKAVGVAVQGDLLVVSDQSHDSLVGCHLPDCTDRALLATIPTPDLMTASEHEIFVSSRDGNVYAVTPEGEVRTVGSDLGGIPRGLAWDAEDQQLFVAVHDPSRSHPRHAIAVIDLGPETAETGSGSASESESVLGDDGVLSGQ
jgi:hypothetical protein